MIVGKIFRSVLQKPFCGRNRSTTASKFLAGVEARLAKAQESRKEDLVKAQESRKEDLVKAQESRKVDLVKAQESFKEDLVKAQESHKVDLAKAQENSEFRQVKSQESFKEHLDKWQESMKEFIKTRDRYMVLQLFTAVGTGTFIVLSVFHRGGGVITWPWQTLQ